MKLLCLFLTTLAYDLDAFPLIVPNELPTLLSVIYSSIPTIKKGTDSRIGWGFRLGDRADFQVLVELGPQTNTQPLANQGEKSNKRHVSNNDLYAQKHISNTDGGRWINQWRQGMKTQGEPILGIGEVDAKSVIPADGVAKLEQLYGKTTEKVPTTTTTEKKALDDVEFDD